MEDDPDDEPVSNHLQLSQFLLNDLIDPFVEEQRKGNSHNVPFTQGMEVPRKASVAFKLDSDINFMKLIKRPEIVARYAHNEVRVQNHAAGYTECGAANDLQQYHKKGGEKTLRKYQEKK